MDKYIYTAASSGNETLAQMDNATHNVANVSTDGFRAKLDVFRAVPVVSKDLPVQTFVINASVGTDFSPAGTRVTGRDLDVAIQGSGWLVVQDNSGKEAYTRAGSLKTDQNGLLQTLQGLYVLSDAGPITLPPDERVTIAKDGTISTIPVGNKIANNNLIGRIKLVNPPENTLVRGDDGLFRTQNGVAADADANVTLVSGSVESSNVNAIEGLVSFISLSKKFELNTKLLTSAQTNDEKASTVLSMNGR